VNWSVPDINLTAGWAGIVLGIVSGMLLGLGFHRDGFLGGYGSLQRRLYRLGHISFFGLAIINLLFWLTVRLVPLDAAGLTVASTALLVGALTMPLCCLLTPHWRLARHGFAVPVLSVLYGSGATLLQLLQPR
jgi:hypothetical protein